MSPKGKERREYKRLKKKLTLRSVSKKHGFISMECKNISIGGAHCISEAKFPVMTKMLVHMFLSSKDGRSARSASPLALKAYVVRCEKIESAKGKNLYELALFFYQPEDSQAELLKKYLQRPTKKRGAPLKRTPSSSHRM
jgi:hypothetical protein